MTFRELYVKEMNGISLSEGFEKRTENLMKQRAKRKDEQTLQKRKPVKILAAALAIIALLSVTAFAVSYYLSASEVAEYFGEKEIVAMFKDSEIEPKTVSNGTYDVTFLGKTTGTMLNMTEGFEADETRTYAVIAMKKTNGTPLSLIDGMPLQPVPVIEGYMPYRTWCIMESSRGLEREGILYYLFDYKNLEIFADRTVSIALIEGAMVPSPEILTTDESGKIVYADGYTGIKGIFELPMDESKADPEAAAKLMSNY